MMRECRPKRPWNGKTCCSAEPDGGRKFDYIYKLLPIVVSRVLQSHKYKQSLSEPFNMAIQTGWGKGLSEACGYRHSIADLLKVHLDSAPSRGFAAPNVSSAPGGLPS
ncbi:hypothetical protein Tco_0949170 [Tanacetum coccineum]